MFWILRIIPLTNQRLSCIKSGCSWWRKVVAEIGERLYFLQNKSARNWAFYQPKANYKQWRYFRVWRSGIAPSKLPRNFIQSEVSIHVTRNNLICNKTGLNVDVKRTTPLFNSFGSNRKGKKVSANRVLITWLICLILTFYPCVRVVYICWCVPTWCAETSYITRAILLQIAKGCHFLV